MKLEAKCFLPLCVPTMIDFLRPGIVTAENGSLETIDVYLDCDRRTCDIDYIRREIWYVNYVRERTEAHIHVLVTTERTGLVRKIEEGLVRYISRTTIADPLEISVAPLFEEETVTSNPLDDPWISWIFGVSLTGDYDAEESTDHVNLKGRLSANRTTEDWELTLGLNMIYRERNFDLGDESITSITENGSFWAYIVRGIGPKWSVGVSSYTDTSTRQNRKLSSSLAPAIEYGFFPYAESDQRQITFVYEFRFQTVEYEELTVFDKTNEKHLSQSLKLNLDDRQPWGSAHAELEGSNFLTDFESSKF